VAVVIVVGAVIASVTREQDRPPGGGDPPPAAALPRERGVGLCLAATVPSGTDEAELVAAVESASTANRYFFPEPFLDLDVDTDPDGVALVTAAVWPSGASTEQVSEWRQDQTRSGCPEHHDGWSLRITRALLADGADRLLAEAEFGDPWTAFMEVELRPAESSIRTVLHFGGPLGISGTCWVDDILSVDPTTGTPVVVAVAGNDAGVFGMIACTRFAESIPDGAAGEQARDLVPTGATLGGPTDLRVVADSITLSEDALVIEGSYVPVTTAAPTLD
jgi:hypothetical protein